MNSDDLTQTDGEAASKASKQNIHCTNTRINMNNANANTNVRPPQPPPTDREHRDSHANTHTSIAYPSHVGDGQRRVRSSNHDE